MIRRSGLATLGVVLAVAVAACGSDGGDDLVFGGEPMSQCVRVPEGASMVIGAVMRAPGDADLVVQKIGLDGAQGVKAGKAFIVPLGSGRTPIGNTNYPPAANVTWDSRVPAENATVRAGEEANLLLVVSRSGTLDGSATGMRIDYLGGTKTNATTYQFRTDCSQT
ncbi:hypothetical protein [Actinoplanes sp. M2I2]|uniref:hypothetical protein n=1 Tax=Actinoplanes sp. M2I2 TaxID=1734444 RepID=UPI002021BC89|nr:hypothetical protein [Actinoplanes sp. M2I2]